jgi:hypothetical protein
LILWLLVGSFFSWERDKDLVQVAEVSMISEDEFAALTAPRSESVAPERPAAPEPAEPEPAETPPAEPEVVPESTPEPEPEAEPETAPPAPAPRVAPEPAPAPKTPVEEAVEVVPAPEPTPEPAPETPPEEVTPTAPPEATTEIVTEAEEPVETPSAAPTTSARPRSRPNNPAPVEPTQPATPETPATENTAENTAANNAAAVARALADAGGSQDNQTQDIPLGPPMTRGEKDGLRVAVSKCWNLGSSSTEALSTTVVVLVTMSREGHPKGVKMASWDGPSQAAANTAFQAARRAIIRCGAGGFDLPADKYGQWREVEMTFNPDKMRVK